MNNDEPKAEERSEAEKREEIERVIAETEDALLALQYEGRKNEELEKLRAKQEKPPELSKLRRSKMTRKQKEQVIKEFGVDTYEKLPH